MAAVLWPDSLFALEDLLKFLNGKHSVRGKRGFIRWFIETIFFFQFSLYSNRRLEFYTQKIHFARAELGIIGPQSFLKEPSAARLLACCHASGQNVQYGPRVLCFETKGNRKF